VEMGFAPRFSTKFKSSDSSGEVNIQKQTKHNLHIE